jgi:hypothetical protein
MGARVMKPRLSPRAPTCSDHSHRVHINTAHRLSGAAEEALVHIKIGLSHHSDTAKNHCLTMAHNALAAALSPGASASARAGRAAR